MERQRKSSRRRKRKVPEKVGSSKHLVLSLTPRFYQPACDRVVHLGLALPTASSVPQGHLHCLTEVRRSDTMCASAPMAGSRGGGLDGLCGNLSRTRLLTSGRDLADHPIESHLVNSRTNGAMAD